MRQSELFTKTSRQFPKDEASISAQLLERAGFVYKNSAGVYSFLPLGWRVVKKIAQIISEEMAAIGGQEVFLPALVERRYLDKTGRWQVDIGFEVKDKRTGESRFVLGWTHEEVAAEIASRHISSYKDLPVAVYQIQTKFRNEPRAKSGLLRTREFLMKDLYSFHASEKDFERYYQNVKRAYQKIFKRVGLKAIYTLAGGGTFTASATHEFQVIAPVGEDTIFVCPKCDYAENGEISKLQPGSHCPKCRGTVQRYNAIEVGNIFPLGTKYSQAFNLQFLDKSGRKNYLVMGSYGIGLGRVMAAAVEVSHDERGIIWPETIAPFPVHLLKLSPSPLADKVYRELAARGISVLYDDRPVSAGEKLVDADLLGIPYRLVVSGKTGSKVEFKPRNSSRAKLLSLKEVIRCLTP